MISFKHHGNFEKTSKYFARAKKAITNKDFHYYGEQGVKALSSATPIDTGETAKSWFYEIVNTKNQVQIQFHNSNINEGVPIAIILQYGHATGNGGWVEGRDYINPAIQSLFDKLAKEAWEEVIKV